MNKMAKKHSIYFSINDRRNGCVQGSSLRLNVFRSDYLLRRLKCDKVFGGHLGCVNTVVWNDSGDLLLSGSDDCQLNIYKPYSMKPIHSINSGHHANIFSAKFLPCTSDTKIASCSGDGILHYNEVNDSSSHGKNQFSCHTGTTYEVNTTPGDPNTFMSSGEDGMVRLFDIRNKTKCACNGCKKDVLINTDKAVTSFSINPIQPYYVAVGCDNSSLYVYDRRTLTVGEPLDGSSQQGLLYQFKPKTLEKRDCRVTSLKYSPNGRNLLASYCSDYVYLFDAKPEAREPLLSAESEKNEETCCPNVDNDPPMKRLRLRGDWSDTGPNARPNGEEPVSSTEDNFERRMSGYFTRWIEESLRIAREERRHARHESDHDDSHDDENNDVSDRSNVTFENETSLTQEVQGSNDVIRQDIQGNNGIIRDEVDVTDDVIQDCESSENNVVDSDIAEGLSQTFNEDAIQDGRCVHNNEKSYQSYKRPNNSQTRNDNLIQYDRMIDDEGSCQNERQPNTSQEGSDDVIKDGSRVLDNEESCQRDIHLESAEQSSNETRRHNAASAIQNFFRFRMKKNDQTVTCETRSYSRFQQVYRGHRNARTMIKEANFWGNDYILSGSDCGRIFIWSRKSADVVMLLEGDRHVVNCVQPHPYLPFLATSGIDYDIKLWTPSSLNVNNMENIPEVISRNERMLRESRDTLTVPASFMIRLLSSLHRVRFQGGHGESSTDEGDSD